LGDVKDPTFGSQMAVMLPALRTGRALLPRNMIFSASGTRFCQRLSKVQGLVRPKD
jgi:hypothetical protein